MSLPRGRRAASVRKEPTQEQKLRARVFCLCKELGICDDARRILAGTIRADRVESTSGMKVGELYEMVRELERRDEVRETTLRQVSAEQRAEQLRKHKRVDGPDSAWASERARHYLRGLAESYWGDDWPQRLGIFLGGLWLKWEARCAKAGQATQRPRGAMQTAQLLFVPWDSPTFPRKFHYEATEAMISMSKRAAKEGGVRR